MPEQTTSIIPDITAAKELIAKMLNDAGFMAFEEFSHTDTLVLPNEQLGFYSLKDCTANASCLHHENGYIYTQTDCTFAVKLMGTASSYADFSKFDERCQEFYVRSLISTECIVRSSQLGRVYQSLPQKRLTRELTLTLRLCVNEPFLPSFENPRFHRAELFADRVIYPSRFEILNKARNVSINTVDGRLITHPIEREPTQLIVSGRFTPDERSYFFALSDDLSRTRDIVITIDGESYTNIIPYECSIGTREGELLGEYTFRFGGAANEL